VRFILTGGNASDDRSAIPLLSGFHARHVIADRAYDSHAILDAVEASGARPIIPQRTCMPRKRAFDPTAYKLRNQIRPHPPKLPRNPIHRRDPILVLNVDSA
jgi:transposase